MPIEISWFDEEKTILFAKFTGEWTWEEYAVSSIDALKLAQATDYRLDQIIDMSASGAIPEGQALTHMNRSYELSRPFKIGLTILVGASTILRGVVSALAITNPNRNPRVFVDSIEEALEMIKNDREKSKNTDSDT